MPTKNAPSKPAAKSPGRPPASDKQYELVQLWRKRDFQYASPVDATEEEIASAKYRPLVTFIQVKINKGFGMDGEPRYKVHKIEMPDVAHPKQLKGQRGANTVESRLGIALSTFRIPAKQQDVVKSLMEHPMCWIPDSKDPWKADRNGKAFYIREAQEVSLIASERATTSDDKPPKMEDKYNLEDNEDEDVVFTDEEVEELVA